MKWGIVGVAAFLVIFGCSAKRSQQEGEKQQSASKPGKICILAISELDPILLEELRAGLEKTFGENVEVTKNPLDLEFAYNPERGQYHSSAILERVSKMASEVCGRTLGIVDVDLYVPDLNFVFGEADMVEETAVISTKRLRPEYYGLPEDERLLGERTLKESVHELGHTYGLRHCPDKKCVMHFSNSLMDTDVKSRSLCSNCAKKLMVIRGLQR